MFTADDVVNNLEDSDIDSYYAATYYPWVKYFDKENNVYINLPATKDAIRNMADVDNKKYPWYAPAGMERGNVDCKKMHFFAKLEDEDTLYDGRINPLKTYSKDGVKIWGNKTLYKGNTPMEGVNVVRLMLYMRKLIIEATRGLIFEPNDITLKNEFESIVKPILAQIKKDRGITDFRLDVSQTPEQMDAHELSATLYVKPTPTLEYIEINFVVTPQGVSFDSI
jgi:phage tail sheath protein FI